MSWLQRYVVLLAVLFMAPGTVFGQETPAVAQVLPLCSPAITNPDCAIRINRDVPSSPLTMKMKSGATATLVVQKRPLDLIQMEVTAADVARPEPAAAILTAFLPSMLKLTFRTLDLTPPPPTPPAAPLAVPAPGAAPPVNPYDALVDRLKAIQSRQEPAREQLQQVDGELQEAADVLRVFQGRTIDYWQSADFPGERDGLATTLDSAAKATHPAGAVSVLRAVLNELTKEIAALPRPGPADKAAQAQFDELIELLDVVTFNQGLLETGMKALEAARVALEQTAAIVSRLERETALVAERRFTHAAAEVGRSVSVKIASQDALSKTVTPLATAVMVWNDTRWEVSAGAIFSWLENRTFQYVPVVIDGQPQLDAAGKVRQIVAETTTQPMVVPFALLHYRLAEAPISGRRLGLLATGGIGVNAGSGTADFAFGGSVSYRVLVLSALIHQGRDLRLSNGVVTGSELAGNPTLATERFWRRTKAIGASLRVVF